MTQEQISEVIEKVKELILLGDDSQDTLLTIYVEEMGQRIIDYCNLYKMPCEMMNLWAMMTADYVRAAQGMNAGIFGDEAASSSAVQSISEGDTSISFGRSTTSSPASISGISKTYIDELLRNYRMSLNRWRRLQF